MSAYRPTNLRNKMSSADKFLKLKQATTLSELAEILGYKHNSLSYILYGKFRLGLSNYSTFSIPKKNGGYRTISSPAPELMELQRRVSDLLHDCFVQIQIINGFRYRNKNIKTISHGFMRGKSIVTNAETHKKKKFVLNIDIENFFDSIHFGRIYGYFLSNKNFELNPTIAKILANIVCHNGSLPQGAPTSPIISNLVAHILDIKLAKIAQENSCQYTRYVDDLTFSTNKNIFPIGLGTIDEKHDCKINEKLIGLIKHSGFTINNKKTRVQYKDSRQEVTGLIVNKKVNVKSEYRNKARILVNKLYSNKEVYKINSTTNEPATIEYIQGVLNYIYQVRLHNSIKHTENILESQRKKCVSKEQIDTTLDADARMYRDFLFFKNFVINNSPLIICEGKTDVIYLRAAISVLSKEFPNLSNSDNGHQLSFFNNTNTTSQLFKINGGTGDLRNLISNYKKYFTKFERFTPESPVIILIDNDSGSATIRSILKEVTKKEFTKKDNFIHIEKNLYVMQTPLQKNQTESEMEDFFTKETLSLKLKNKSFCYKGEFNKNSHYGKNHFAEYVIKPQKKTINFSNFKVIFDIINLICDDYKQKIKNPIKTR
ncbi:Retron-type reverse transcriptase [Yersinia enterocolitica]|nr:RNA-directed DNA polymerase [Yersinia enterocolitica]EKN6152122.1 RNA-directed DNA polymerase [Yersinia enterocolitica]CQH26627.1 Retron-type reverse transcriptase [Yersinia enterocolitica]